MLTIEKIIRFGNGDMVFTSCAARYGENIYCFIARDSEHASRIVTCLQGSDIEMMQAYDSITKSSWFPFAEAETYELAMDAFKTKLIQLPVTLEMLQQFLSSHDSLLKYCTNE